MKLLMHSYLDRNSKRMIYIKINYQYITIEIYFKRYLPDPNPDGLTSSGTQVYCVHAGRLCGRSSGQAAHCSGHLLPKGISFSFKHDNFTRFAFKSKSSNIHICTR